MVGQHVQTIGIHHGGSLCATYLRDERNGGVLLLAESGTDSHCIHVIAVNRFREILFVVVWIDDCLGNADLHHVVVTTGRTHDDFSGSRTQTGLRGQDGSTSHTVTAGHNECRAHISFVGEFISRNHQRPDFRLFQYHELSIHLADALFAEADVENLQFTDELLVLRKKECQFLLLKRERHVSPDNVGTYVICVVFGHQSRRHIDAYDG